MNTIDILKPPIKIHIQDSSDGFVGLAHIMNNKPEPDWTRDRL